MKTINSKRRFLIVGLSNGIQVEMSYFLDDILNEENNSELNYSLQDELDEILDLNVGNSLVMYSNRDAKNGKNRIIVYRNQ